jgi:hypothetical protein
MEFVPVHLRASVGRAIVARTEERPPTRGEFLRSVYCVRHAGELAPQDQQGCELAILAGFLAREPEPLRSALGAYFATPPPFLGVPLDAAERGPWAARVSELEPTGASTFVYLGSDERAAALRNWRDCYAALHVSCVPHVDEFAVLTGVTLVRAGAAPISPPPEWLSAALARLPVAVRSAIVAPAPGVRLAPGDPLAKRQRVLQGDVAQSAAKRLDADRRGGPLPLTARAIASRAVSGPCGAPSFPAHRCLAALIVAQGVGVARVHSRDVLGYPPALRAGGWRLGSAGLPLARWSVGALLAFVAAGEFPAHPAWLEAPVERDVPVS